MVSGTGGPPSSVNPRSAGGFLGPAKAQLPVWAMPSPNHSSGRTSRRATVIELHGSPTLLRIYVAISGTYRPSWGNPKSVGGIGRDFLGMLLMCGWSGSGNRSDTIRAVGD
ncbi:hypothetical protein AB0M45_17200 [Nocardia sp. NPDC051787]|uniref:hypothetical protein n=1 Tax=Nocardia sp. NPDC051787 TaxID=3155415 RepID=UPI00344AAC45